MQLKLYLSWLFFGVGAVLGAQLDVSNVPLSVRASSAFWAGYAFWALFWGVPVVFRWWWKRSSRGPLFLRLVLVLMFLPLSCMLFSFYGGGIYLFLKTWWLVSKSKTRIHGRVRAEA